MTINLAGIEYESKVNGVGIRRVFFSQGCTHNCKNCFNPSTHSFYGGKEFDTDELANKVFENPLLDGVTFSGGDPFQQSKAFYILSKKLKEKNINIWAYTGYTIEEILKNNISYQIKLLNNVDVLVDGRFDEKLYLDSLKFKGSTNQRIINVPRTLQEEKIILWRN